MRLKIPPPVLLVTSGAVMWFIARSAFAFPLAVPYSSAVAVVLGATGVLIGLLAVRQFRLAETTVNPFRPEKSSALVRTGIFGKSRNPMYVGLLVILIGWAVWLGSLSNILVLILFWVVITELQIKPEEAALRTLFGQDYEKYCRQVARWV